MCLCSSILKTLLITSTVMPRIDWDENNSAISCAFSGNDLTNSLTKSSECGALCASTSGCSHYTWTDFNSGTCWLKTNTVSKSDAYFKSDQNALCGIVVDSENQIQWNDQNSASHCAFSGNDLMNFPSKPEDCPDLCASTQDCTHYTWTDFNSGVCWMKENVVAKSDAIQKLDQNAICGVIDRPMVTSENDSPVEIIYAAGAKYRSFPQWISDDPELNSTDSNNLSENGRSTRYWDCCKPSCSWNGKASVTNPVNSCSKDGFNVIDRNAQNGCGGGNAFTCNNNIPWAINDNLAYGFAAAHIRGKSEADWCCKCYELRFTSGPVNGKKMIVQVTNTGGDLGENHFDIQMPGGGVGIFNGCTSQWGAPNGGWGDRYGGVHNIGDCDQLPSQIRQGCKWRFQWFKGADNPTFDFHEVGCPDELTSKTGCSRH